MIRFVVFLLAINKCLQVNISHCDKSDGTSICCPGFQYDSILGTCVHCPKGYFGISCEHPCPYPQFGDFCQNQCTCEINDCNNVEGCAKHISTHKGTRFRNMKLHTDSTTSIFLSGTIGYAISQKLTSSTSQKIIQKYNDTKLSSSSIHVNNTTPIRLSVIVLVCLSAIIIMLYLALYARDHTNDIKKLVFCNWKTNCRTYSSRNVNCNV
ncbi:uncharacterized protein LOC128182993 [Crassostrea angulata]|uniref:uncharacterized protein LOC128182993 n=1 Tax=Magallana angulata TaxID=2784310 RepID=UPI0022B0B536|nr:uncharacterized protein LOC128182993 [Crassostrea angulata]